jgi:hypothetical protein
VTGLSITIFHGTECQELYLDRPLRHPLGWISHDVIASVASHPWEDFTAHRMTHPFLQLRRHFRSGVTLTNRSPHHQRGPVLPLLPTYLNEIIRKGQPVTADSHVHRAGAHGSIVSRGWSYRMLLLLSQNWSCCCSPTWRFCYV